MTTAEGKREQAAHPSEEPRAVVLQAWRPETESRLRRTRLRDGEPYLAVGEAVGIAWSTTMRREMWDLAGRAPDSPFADPAPFDEEWVTYDLTCDLCKDRQQHASVPLREENLWPLLDLLVEHFEGPVCPVTPEFLAQMDQRRREQGDNKPPRAAP